MSEVIRLIVEVIKAVEWITFDAGFGYGMTSICPICRQNEKYGHHDKCNMGIVIKMLGGDSNGVSEAETQAEK